MTTKRKPTKQTDSQSARKEPEVLQNEQLSTIYSNIVEVRQSLYDFRLTFGLIHGVKDDRLQIEPLQTIIISPQHAKELSQVLAANVRAYEKEYMLLQDSKLNELKEPKESELTN